MVARNVSSWVGNVNLDSGAVVDGSLTGDRRSWKGPIAGDLQAYGGELWTTIGIGRNDRFARDI